MIHYKSTLKYICLVIALCCFALLTLNCQNITKARQNGSKSAVDTNKFTIVAPAGWHRQIQTSSGFEILFIMAPAVDNFSPNINILTESIRGVSIDEYFKKSMENMKDANMIMDGSGDFEANGMQGKYSTSSFNYHGKNIATKTYIFLKDGLVYVLTGSCLTTQKDVYRPIFDQTVKTFKLK